MAIIKAQSRPPPDHAANQALAEWNSRNRAFWDREQAQTDRLISDDAVLAHARRAVAREADRGVPVYYQQTFEWALREAEEQLRPVREFSMGQIEKLKAEFRREQARRGGSARKTDTLQELVEQIASRMPGITSRQLQDRLQDRQGDGVVEYIEDSVISFRTQGGRIKTAPISGLKDRLSRAKKKLPSR